MEEKNIKILPFNLDKNNWNIWSRKFLFKIIVQGRRDIILEYGEIKSENKYHQ